MNAQILPFPPREPGLDTLPRAEITATQRRLDGAVASLLTVVHHDTAKCRASLHVIGQIAADDTRDTSAARSRIALIQAHLDEAMDELAMLIRDKTPLTQPNTGGSAA
jgi:hypothetical protein